jgi:mono/diheme cytochrome c family protein
MKKYLAGLMLITFAACNNPGSNAPEKTTAATIDGEQLYKVNCAQCHKPAEEFIGPALKNASAHWKSKQLLYEFVRNSQEVIQKDEYAKALFVKYNQSPMLPMPHLKEEDIEAIFKYCDAQ